MSPWVPRSSPVMVSLRRPEAKSVALPKPAKCQVRIIVAFGGEHGFGRSGRARLLPSQAAPARQEPRPPRSRSLALLAAAQSEIAPHALRSATGCRYDDVPRSARASRDEKKREHPGALAPGCTQNPAITYSRPRRTTIGPGCLTAVFGMGTGVAIQVCSPGRSHGIDQVAARVRSGSSCKAAVEVAPTDVVSLREPRRGSMRPSVRLLVPVS